MGNHPANLALRFGLELAALTGLGYWGWKHDDAVLRWILAFGLPVVAATLWGVFAVPNDPSRSGRTVVPTPGWVRLFLEMVFFAAGGGALAHAGMPWAALVLGALVLGHYLASYDRIAWLLKR